MGGEKKKVFHRSEEVKREEESQNHRITGRGTAFPPISFRIVLRSIVASTHARGRMDGSNYTAWKENVNPSMKHEVEWAEFK